MTLPTHPRMATSTGRVEPVPRRVRALAGGRTVVDTTDARYVWEHRWYPQFLLPPDAVPADVVAAEGRTDTSPLGEVEVFTLVLDDRRVAGGARRLTDDGEHDGLAGWWRLDWAAFDEWREEDERLHGTHPRSPYVRVDSLPSSRTVRIEVDGVVVAESDRPVMLFETGLPTRYYLPSEDVDPTHLEPIELRTSCPYKGTVSDYWDVRVGDVHVEQAAWRYTETLRESAPVAGHIAFLNDRVDVFVDGVPERPAA